LGSPKLYTKVGAATSPVGRTDDEEDGEFGCAKVYV
jgi:hypothetical protein